MLAAPAAGQDPAAGEQRREAAGWLELSRSQRAYRERVAPLTLREQRELSVIERSQRLDLRAEEQRRRRAIAAERREQPLAQPPGVQPLPPRVLAPRLRRDDDRLRLRLQMQQQRLPFGRR